MPDPQRLGGLAWARRTGGQLSRAERRRLLAATAIGQWQNAVGRAKLALGRLPAGAAHVDLDTFRVPDSRFAREAEEACAELPPTLRGHSYRTWLFGRALAAVDGSTMDDELFYCGALLHDYGIVAPTANRDFTLGSVDRMLGCAGAVDVGEQRADLLADGIVCTPHRASRSRPTGRSAATCNGERWSTAPDCAAGTSLPAMSRRCYAVIRGDFKRELVEMIRAEAAAVPAGRMALLVRCGMPLAVRLAPFDS